MYVLMINKDNNQEIIIKSDDDQTEYSRLALAYNNNLYFSDYN